MATKEKYSQIANFVKILVIICLAVSAGGLYYLIYEKPETSERNIVNDYHRIEVDGQSYRYNTSLVGILFLGIDAREDEQGQSDSIELLLFDRKSKEMKIVSLSRDIMCEIELFDAANKSLGYDKQHLGLAYSYGDSKEKGCLLAANAVSRLFNQIPIINYFSFNMQDIAIVHSLVETLDITLPDDSLASVNPDWVSGKVIQLNSDNVELFLRTRDTTVEFSNEIRMQRQKLYIKAYLKKIKYLSENELDHTLKKLLDIAPNFCTNITISEMNDYAIMLKECLFDEQEDYYEVTGENHVGEYHDEVIVDKRELERLILALFYRKGE